jgi:PEP-CTERM motif-containing protein
LIQPHERRDDDPLRSQQKLPTAAGRLKKEGKKEKGKMKKLTIIPIILIVAFVALLPLAASAVPTTLTFSEFPVGTIVSNQYAPQGVVFLPGTNGNFPIIANDAAMPTSPVLSPNPPFSGDFGIRFPSGATDVSFLSGFWDVAHSGIINVFTPSNALIGTFTNPGTGVQTFNFDGDVIGRISFNSLADPAGADIDNLTFSPVPEPSTVLLLASSLVGLGGAAWRRNRGR